MNTTKENKVSPTDSEILTNIVWHRTFDLTIDSDGDDVVRSFAEDYEPLRGVDAFYERRVELEAELERVENVRKDIETDEAKSFQIIEKIQKLINQAGLDREELDPLYSQTWDTIDSLQLRAAQRSETWENRNGQTLGLEFSDWHIALIKTELAMVSEGANDVYLSTFREVISDGYDEEVANAHALESVQDR